MPLVPSKMLPNVVLVYITYRLAKMLILQNNEAKEAVNSKLRDLDLDEVDLDSDDKRDDQSHTEGTCVDLFPIYRPNQLSWM